MECFSVMLCAQATETDYSGFNCVYLLAKNGRLPEKQCKKIITTNAYKTQKKLLRTGEKIHAFLLEL